MKKIIFNILIVVVMFCASDCSVYDWHVKTIERDSDFANDFKVQTALNNERQQDLLKISGKINNPNSFNTHFSNKYTDESDNKASNINAKNRFNNQNNSNPFGSKLNIKYEENSKPINDQKENPASKNQTKTNKNVKDGNDDVNDLYNYNDDHSYFKFIDDHLKNYKDNNNDHQYDHKEFNKQLNNHKLLDYHDEDNNSYHDLNHIKHNSYKPSEDQDTYEQNNGQLALNSKNEENGRDNDKQIPNKDKQDLPIVNHCTGKYLNIESFVGTNLFDSTAKRCFSNEEVALLATRKDFESLIPKDLPECLLNDQMVALLLNYFYICHQMILKTTSVGFRHLAQKAFYDTLGGYLNFYIVPVTKYSYYAGQISLNTAQQILTLHQESKQFLNTNGNSWKAPLKNVLMELKSIHIEPLHIADLDKEDTCDDEPSFCMLLDITANENQFDNDQMMIVQLPKLEPEDYNGYLGNIWLPFRRKRTFDLKSESSAYVLVKFYETVTKCYRFENMDQHNYNQLFKTWLLEQVNIHLSDNQFYPGLGAVLRIYEYLKGRKKDTSLFDDNLVKMQNKDESLLNHQSPQIRSRKTHSMKKSKNRTNVKKHHTEKIETGPREGNKTIEHDSKIPLHINLEITKDALAPQSSVISSDIDDNKQVNAAQSKFPISRALLRTIDLTPTQMVIITIPAIAIILVVIICCCKSFCKKKKSETQLKPKKSSSSSSSNLLNSPVRFFHIRKKSLSDYSTNEPGNKKSKKSVKIEKKPLLNSDTSASSSPVRNKKSINKGKSKDSGKSNV